MTFRITVLGSGGWEGIPTPFCKCKVCLSSRKALSKDERTRPELLVETETGRFLIEISPDIRMQSSRFGISGIYDFIVSHWHFDHMYGLLELHAFAELTAERKVVIHGSKKTCEWLGKYFSHILKDTVMARPYEPFDIAGVKITPLPLYHMRSQDDGIKEDALENTFGYLLERENMKVAYLADYYRVPERVVSLIRGSDIIIADGTYLLEEQFPSRPEQNGLKADPDHLHGTQILSFVRSLSAKAVIFHSITHLPEKTHDELQGLMPEGMSASYDGMVLDLSR